MSEALRGHLAMLMFSALVAGSFSLGVMVANEIAPAALNAARFGIAAVVIGVAAMATTGLQRAHFRAPWRFAVLGGLFGGYFVLMFYGLQTAAPVSAAAVFTLVPVMSALFGWLLLRQVTSVWMALALAIGAGGAMWVIVRGDLGALAAFEIGQGEIIYFWGCVLHAIYTPMVRKLNRGEPAVVFTFGMLLAGGALLAVFGWRDIQATDWAQLPGIVWIGLFYLAVCASSATFVLLQYAAMRLPSAKVMAYTYLTPSWVILWEIALGRGAPPGMVLIGVAMSVVALVMLLEGDAKTVRA
ncbi:DMT family transporter [Leisingera thetidis]|uniref:DMT family transporter n=1 Tax=Leisingera thetidis TaxID=2930199 RepID=UPI0021F7483B|nr:DMT family transporter [Leisingera thetidis]